MSRIRRRSVVAGLGATLALGACTNPIGGDGAARLDARVDATRKHLLDNYSGTRTLMEKSHGILYMPLVSEASFGIGGRYGRGALRIDEATVDYYSAAGASLGFQIGAQQFGHALFFMTEEALSEFRRGGGWEAGGDLRYALPDQGGTLGADTTTQGRPVIALVFGQSGLIAGASLRGVKYTRIIP